MAGTTAINGLPYATGGDPADGAGNEQSMMTAVDTALAGLRAVKAGPQTFANNTVVTITGMSVAYAINSVYRIEGYIIYQALAAAGTRFTFLAGAGTTVIWTANALAASVTAATSGIILRASQVLADIVPIGAAGLGTDVTAQPYGYLTTTGTSGSLQMGMGQVVTTGGSPTVLQAGSQLWLRKVA
jgi:hypothetical protein